MRQLSRCNQCISSDPRFNYLRVEHLLRELRNRHGPVLLAPPGREGREPGHEEVEPGEGDHVDGQLAEVGVQLTGEPQAGRHAGHRDLRINSRLIALSTRSVNNWLITETR